MYYNLLFYIGIVLCCKFTTILLDYQIKSQKTCKITNALQVFWTHFTFLVSVSYLIPLSLQCLRIFGCILQVLLVSAGKIMSAAEILLGAHVEVIVLYMVEYGIDTCY